MCEATLTIGIDPGFSGAVAFVSSDMRTAHIYDMPTVSVSFVKRGKQKNRAEIDKKSLVDLIKQYRPRIAKAGAFIEAVSAMPNQGVTGVFRFGHGLGIIEGVLAALDVPVIKVRPQDWKAEFDIIHSDKSASLFAAKAMFPDAQIKLAKHHGRAEAALIAVYGIRLASGTLKK